MAQRKRYAIVGTGSRAFMFAHALLGPHREDGELVGLCDINPARMQAFNEMATRKSGGPLLPMYSPDRFEAMIAEQRVDRVIVTSMDRTHHEYICRAMRAGCDAVSEKPMTIDADKCQQIFDAIDETGRQLTVTFNYRYAPRNSKVKELLMDGAIGRVLSVHFEWLLHTHHGADYFRRWHRDKRNSGGLMVHKSTHHFDLVNWWINAQPSEVYAMGDLSFYGRANAEARGQTQFYQRAHGSEIAKSDPFALDLNKNEQLRRLYLEAEHADGYQRDQSVFGDGISTEDDVAVLVRYDSGATMSYHLTAYSPWEGFRVSFNGTRGRLQYDVVEAPYVSGAQDDHNLARNVGGSSGQMVCEPTVITVQPLWGKPIRVDVAQSNTGGHGGGDQRLMRDVFQGAGEDPLGRAAGHVDGARSILTGIAANRSMATGQPVRVGELLRTPLPAVTPTAGGETRCAQPAEAGA